MRKVTTTLIDDCDPDIEAAETITFALDGETYEIDLGARNATKLRDQFAPWLLAGRRVSGRKHPTHRTSDVDNRAVRAWAESTGQSVNKRGRVPESLVVAFREAHI